MKKILMTLFAAATILAVGCKKDENAVADEESMARMAGIWRLDEIKFDDVVIHPEDYENYVPEEYMDEYNQVRAAYQNGVLFTFYANGKAEVYGEEFEWQIRDNASKIVFSGNIVVNVNGHDVDFSDRELPCDLTLTDNEANLAEQIPGFVIPMPHFFHFPGGEASCRLVRVGDAPEYPENPADTI